MKKCPFRADDIQDAAIKCPHFGSSLLAERSSPTAASRVKIIDAVERTVITAENVISFRRIAHIPKSS